MLVSCREKNGNLAFEIHKEGLLILRKFKNKRLRIIFNISQSNKELQSFNRCFLSAPPHNNFKHEQNNNNCYLSWLEISNHCKQLSNNRVILCLNMYRNDHQSHLVVLGYLVASVFFYHLHGQFTEDGNLTSMLSDIKRLLEGTRIEQLQEQIKHKSGCCKKPYFMCIFDEKMDTQKSYREYFRDFYKLQEGKKTLNEAVQSLIDYFPERNAISIYKDTSEQRSKRISLLGKQYEETILGRQILNFEITGSSLENLCFEICQHYNKQQKSINLVSIYEKIINNQKNQVFDTCHDDFCSLLGELKKRLPCHTSQFVSAYFQIYKKIIEDSISSASNCMIFSQYQGIFEKISTVMCRKFTQSSELNRQELRNRAVSLYQAIQDDQVQKILEDDDKSSLKKAGQLILQKLNILFEQCIGQSQYTLKNLLSSLTQKYFQLHQQKVDNILQKQQQIQKELKSKIRLLEQEKRQFTAKCKCLQDELKYEINLNEQMKEKFLTSQQSLSISISNNQSIEASILIQLKKKCLEMEAQIMKKNQTINQLQMDFQLWQPDHSHKNNKMKFNKNCQSLLNEVTKKISDISSLFQDLKKTEQYYQEVEKKFEERKRNIQKTMIEDRKILSQLNSRQVTLLKEKSELENIVMEEKKAIETYKQTIGQYEEVIKQLEGENSRLKCMVAEIQAHFQTYKKALELTVQCCVTKKVEAANTLNKFCVIQKDQRLKQLLKRVLKK